MPRVRDLLLDDQECRTLAAQALPRAVDLTADARCQAERQLASAGGGGRERPTFGRGGPGGASEGGGRGAGRVEAVDQYSGDGGRRQTRWGAGDGGLAGSIRTDERDRLAGTDVDRHAEQGAE